MHNVVYQRDEPLASRLPFHKDLRFGMDIILIRESISEGIEKLLSDIETATIIED